MKKIEGPGRTPKSIPVDLPSVEFLTADLTIDRDLGVQLARDRRASARREELNATRCEADALNKVEQVRRALANGSARAADLEAAVIAHQAAALALPTVAAQCAAAESAEQTAVAEAKHAIVREANKRRDRLQRQAQQLAPVLEELRQLETALDEALHRVVPGAVVAPLEWPCSLDDEGARLNALRQPR
jgi:vacuolar-type H+-ATPase subunit I/STV1